MEKQAKAIDFIADPHHLFVMFKPMNRKQDKFEVMTTCTCYNDLFIIISDLIKVAILALENDDEQGRSIAKLLEIIYDLIPMEEGNLLDILYKQYLEQKKESENNQR
jgi:formylmethanofuran dehydrogenase subunit E